MGRDALGGLRMKKREHEDGSQHEKVAGEQAQGGQRLRAIHEMSLEEIIEAEILRHVVRGTKRRSSDRARRR